MKYQSCLLIMALDVDSLRCLKNDQSYGMVFLLYQSVFKTCFLRAGTGPKAGSVLGRDGDGSCPGPQITLECLGESDPVPDYPRFGWLGYNTETVKNYINNIDYEQLLKD